jgi:hypothetical protein
MRWPSYAALHFAPSSSLFRPGMYWWRLVLTIRKFCEVAVALMFSSKPLFQAWYVIARCCGNTRPLSVDDELTAHMCVPVQLERGHPVHGVCLASEIPAFFGP